MNRNTEYVLSAILILLVSFFVFGLNISGMTSREAGQQISIKLTDKAGNPQTEFMKNEYLRAEITVGPGKEVMNSYSWLHKDVIAKGFYDSNYKPKVGGTHKKICGNTDFVCGPGTYVIEHTKVLAGINNIKDGETFYLSVEEHIDPRDHDLYGNEFRIYEPFIIDGIVEQR